jgi:hypothetical protein
MIRQEHHYPGEIHVDKNRNGGPTQGEKLKVKSTCFHRRTKHAKDYIRCVIVNEDSAALCSEQSYIVDVNSKHRMNSMQYNSKGRQKRQIMEINASLRINGRVYYKVSQLTRNPCFRAFPQTTLSKALGREGEGAKTLLENILVEIP